MTPELPAHPRVAATHGPGYSSGTKAISSTKKTNKGFSCKLLAFVSELQRSSPSPRAVKEAGGTLVAGSDAPVDTRDPRPFVNMAIGVTRRIPGQQPQNPSQAVGIRDVIDTYTINGARFLHRDAVAGSLEMGKSADFIVVDRDILQLAASGHADDIARTHVLETWFQGKEVYVRPSP